MRNDRELLELAAKAAGIAGVYDTDLEMLVLFDSAVVPTMWNPLIDDGDALRLAVNLHLWFRPMAFLVPEAHEVEVHLGGDGMLANEPANGAPCAATRRAIVRAAAAIGKAMK